ncbi:MAG: hypothetical protein HY883_06005 [Deltaproteobacteria bacterium]|nr:hypothetical protein [Deltaproteobacteria bacterium]
MRRHGVLPLFLFVLLSSKTLTAFAAAPPGKEIKEADYYYGQALYHLFTGDYFSSYSRADYALKNPGGERNKLILLGVLSDQKRLGFVEGYPAFTDREKDGGDPSEILWLLDSLYRSRAYQSLISVSPEVTEASKADYFMGMGYLRLGKSREASLFLSKVHKEDEFYPYARAAIAQTDIARRDLESAEYELRNMLSLPGVEGEFKDRVNLMLGEVLFEQGRYGDAVTELGNIPEESPSYRDALIAAAWSLVKRGYFDEAIALAGKIRPAAAYDTHEWERLVILSYSHAKLDRFAEAAVYFNGLMDSINAAQKKFDAMIEDPSLRGVSAGYLLGKNTRPRGTHPQGGPDEEVYYLPVFGDDEGLADLIEKERVFLSMESAFLKEESEIAGKETYIKNMISAMEGVSEKVDIETGVIRKTVAAMSKKLDAGKTSRVAQQNISFFSGALQRIYDRWETVLKRRMNEDEKNVIRLILYEGSEAMECPEPSVVCLIIHITFALDDRMLRDVGDPKRLQDATKVLEEISVDLADMRKGEPVEYEKDIERLKGIARKKVGNGKVALKTLDDIRERVRKSVEETYGGVERNETEFDGYMKRRLERARYELAGFIEKADVLTKLISQGKGEAKVKADDKR